MSGAEECPIKLIVQWADLLSSKSITSQAVHVNGLDWFLHLDIVDDDLLLRVGLTQSQHTPVTCATQLRYILESTGTRFTHTRGTFAICDFKSYWPYASFKTQWIQQHFVNDGALTVLAELKIFKPVHFSPIPPHFAYSFSAPAECLYPVAERNGLIYLLAKHSVVSPVIEQWAVQYMRAFAQSAVTLALIRVKPGAFVGTSINTNQIALTQVDKEGGRIQLDLVELSGGGVETLIYPLPQNGAEFIWSIAVLTSKGWMLGARSTDEDATTFSFWLLTEKMEVFTQVTRSAVSSRLPQSIGYSALYCMFETASRQCLLVCELDEPTVWKEYEMCPAIPCYALLHHWSPSVTAASCIFNEGFRLFLYRLEFTTTECLLTPWLALPQSFGDLQAMSFNPETILMLLDGGRLFTVVHLTPTPLKMLALLRMQRMLGVLDRQDHMGQPMWKQWKDKLVTLMGTHSIEYL